MQGTMSSIQKPLSAITAMSLSRRGIMPDCLNSSLSRTEPEYRDDTHVTAPCGDTPIKPFRAVCDLYCEKSSLCNTNDDGVWHLHSVQSIMTCVSLYFPNTLGMCCCFNSVRGHPYAHSTQHSVQEICPCFQDSSHC